jgi:UDPglucose 6-dehydrogenase
MSRIGFIGLSHLGLNYSLATAAKGFAVVAYDPNAALALNCAAGKFPIEEPGFAELFAQHRGRIRYTADLDELAACELVFYGLDVRTNEKNESDLGPLTSLIESTAPRLNSGATAVILSQVTPGYTRALSARLAGKSAAKFYYQVETLIFGRAVERAMQPERYMVGAPNPVEPLPAPLRAWHAAFGCPVLAMRFESAELAKIAINFFLVSTVCTTNTLAEMCEVIGADWNEIAPALRLDQRIGPHAYLKPGLGVSGGNLERDLVTVRTLAARHNTETGIVAAWQHNSAHRKEWPLRMIRRHLLSTNPQPRLAIWGIAYKEDTHSIKNSPSVELMRALPGHTLHAYDPAAQIDPATIPHVSRHPKALDVLPGADALAIMTPWAEFKNIPPAEIRAKLKGSLVIDPYGVLDRAACAAAGLQILQLGRG